MKKIEFFVVFFLVILLFPACFIYIQNPNNDSEDSVSSENYREINSTTMSFDSDSDLYMFIYNIGNESLDSSNYSNIFRGTAARNAIDVDDENFAVELEDTLGEGYHCGLALKSVRDAYKNMPPLVNARAVEPQTFVRDTYKTAAKKGDVAPFYKRYTDSKDGNEYSYRVEAECVYVNDVCQVFVEENMYYEFETDETSINYLGNIYVTYAGAKAIAENFKKVYSPVQNIMGKATLDKVAAQNIIETSEKITILIADLGEYKGVATLGYFYSGDLYCGGQKDSSGGNLETNERMMITLNTEGFSKSYGINQLYSTLGHELNHMINFIKKNLEQRINETPTWFTEMLSAITEDFTQNILEIESTLQSERFKNFNYGSSCGMIDGWDKSDVVMFNYGNVYAFGAYLVRNYGGVELIKKMATNIYIGKEAVTAALKACSYNETYETVLQKFGLVMVNPYGYDKDIPTLYKEKSSTYYDFKKINLYDYKVSLSEEELTYYTNPNWSSNKKGPCFYKCTGKSIYYPATLYQGGFYAVYLGKAKDWNYALSFNPPSSSSKIKAYIYVSN